MQSTIAFTPTADDLEDGYVDPAALTFAPPPVRDDEESEPGEP